MPISPIGTTATIKSSAGAALRRHRRCATHGFTLIEVSLVVLMMGLMVVLVAPNFFRAGGGDAPFEDRFSLWMELLWERSQFRGQVFLLEIDPFEDTFRAVTLLRRGSEIGGTPQMDAPVELVEVEDEFVDATIELPENWTILDATNEGGEKFSQEPMFVVIFPYGWIEPFALHVQTAEGDELTAIPNSPTGRIEWFDGYVDLVRQRDDGGI